MIRPKLRLSCVSFSEARFGDQQWIYLHPKTRGLSRVETPNTPCRRNPGNHYPHFSLPQKWVRPFVHFMGLASGVIHIQLFFRLHNRAIILSTIFLHSPTSQYVIIYHCPFTWPTWKWAKSAMGNFFPLAQIPIEINGICSQNLVNVTTTLMWTFIKNNRVFYYPVHN